MRAIGLILVLAFGPLGCKHVHYNKADVFSRHNSISGLKDRVDAAYKNDVEWLAPEHFAKAKELLDRAVKEAQNSEDPDAGVKTADDGLKYISSAEDYAKAARTVLANALQKRSRAMKVHANLLYEKEFAEVDKDLKEAGHALEVGNKKFALEKDTSLATRYTNLEVRALKTNISESADEAYKKATKANANHLAPLTLKAAKNELDIAHKIIDVEKENFDKAQFHAEQARYLAKRAQYIAELITTLKGERLTGEQEVLWYQKQLELAHAGLPAELKFDKSNAQVIDEFASDVKRLAGNLHNVETHSVAHEALFQEVTAMFQPDEAEVVRLGNDLILRCYGFYFPVGKSGLDQSNYALLNKIVSAINKFPKNNIEVVGHTDSTGSQRINTKLSDERAKNIADFLVKVANIDPNRVSSMGVGDENPVASNATEEGRAKNRRIEIIIKNAR